MVNLFVSANLNKWLQSNFNTQNSKMHQPNGYYFNHVRADTLFYYMYIPWHDSP